MQSNERCFWNYYHLFLEDKQTNNKQQLQQHTRQHPPSPKTNKQITTTNKQTTKQTKNKAKQKTAELN